LGHLTNVVAFCGGRIYVAFGEQTNLKIEGERVIERRSKSRPNFSSELFRSMRTEEIDAVLAAAIMRKFEPRQVIIHTGEPAARLFLIRTGRVNYYRLTPEGREVAMKLLGPGDVFGLGTLLAEPTEYLGTAQAVRAGEALVWTHASLRKLNATHPKLAENALRIVLGYLALYADRHIGLISKTAEKRLADTLIRLARNFGRVVPQGVQLDIKNDNLASLADVNFFTASRVLKAWERSGAIKKGRGRVTVLRPEKLCVECP
jgi:CRP/FNR family transcriptional regulator, nitrogen oxide reductase regulator